jgi:cell division protein FtsQ
LEAERGPQKRAARPSAKVRAARQQAAAEARPRRSRAEAEPSRKSKIERPEAPAPRPRNLRVLEKPADDEAAPRARRSIPWRAWAERLRRPALLTLRTLSVVAALCGAVAVGRLVQHHLTTAPAFAIDTVDVRGLARLSRSELLAAAGIDLGTNVFAKSPEEVRARLLAHPWIAAATVARKLPSRFDIEVREREPVALLLVEACPEPVAATSQDPACDDPSSLYLVSDEATVFKRLEGQDPADLPVITGFDKKRLAEDREAEQRLLKEAAALLSEYRGAGLYKRLPIGEIHVEPGGGFSLYVGDDLTHVRLGVPPFPQKLRRMKKVFDRLEREKTSAEYVYLDNELRPDRVTVRLR